MQNELIPQAERYLKKQRRFKLWQRIVGALACVVVFCTTYALILPAITMEQTAYCGMEDHVHTAECYERRLICGFDEDVERHDNSEALNTDGVSIELHESSDESGTVHVHTDECYEQRQELICELEETSGHIHDESCVQTEQVLVCTEDHEHTEECFEQSEVYICGLTEGEGSHTHGPECYETQTCLTCDLDEVKDDVSVSAQEVHVHTDACYEEVLICEKPEHTHTLSCFSNPHADVESKTVWERTMADVELTGVWADDLVAIADSQVGYKESTANYIVKNDGISINGYTRYGEWYGSSYADWCAMFVSFCLHYAQIPQTAVPYSAGCETWADKLSSSEWDLYRNPDEYTPAKGDLIFFDIEDDEGPDHVGIVAEYLADTGQIKTIEGNYSDRVQYVTHSINDKKICGYGQLPQRVDPVKETTKTATIYTDGSYEVLSEDETLITLTGILPKEAEVKAFPAMVETPMEVLCAYDISIVMPDGTLFEPAEGESINVAIHANEIGADEAASNTTAYFIPADSEPVPLDTSIDEDGAFSFDTDHFSIYALMRSGTMPAVYINGASGNDENAGTQSAPVKTLNRALELVAENGTIYVSGTMTVNTEQNWSITVPGVKVQRAPGFIGPLVTVASGGSLTLSNLTMDGGNGGTLNPLLTNNNSRYSPAYATNSAKAPLIVVNTGGSLHIADGTVLENNSNKPNTYNGAFSQSGYIGLGGAIYSTGTLTMTGGLIQDCEAQSGGGIYVENGTFTLSGGTIDHNFARNIQSYDQSRAVHRTNAGGGVYMGDNSSMIMSGGVVSNNESSREGGGISLGWLNRGWGNEIPSFITNFTMTGGTFTGNKALSTGGGLNVTAGRMATISAGHFTHNSAYGYDSQGNAYGGFRVFSGGGIYVDAAQWNSSGQYAGEPGKLIVHRVIITRNNSDFEGGGIAACPTGISHINASQDLANGSAIYGNTADPNLVGTRTEVAIKNMTSDDSLTDTVLGGGSYGWDGPAPSSGNPEYSVFGNSLTEQSQAVIDAKELATVWITDNHGYLGGGIGNNGIIQVGGETEGDKISISITKQWSGIIHSTPDSITVRLYQDGQPYVAGPYVDGYITIYKTVNSENQEIWPTYYIDGLPSGHTYTIVEVPVMGYTGEVTQDGNSFTVTNTSVDFGVLKKWIGDQGVERPTTISVQLYQNNEPYGDPVELSQTNNWFHGWTNLPEMDGNNVPYVYEAHEVNIPDGYYLSSEGINPENGIWEITNTKMEMTTISAEKRWAPGTPPGESVTLQLLADGQPYGNAVVLNGANNWFYRWEDLPKYTPNGVLIAYTVTETTPGYWATVEVADPTQAGNSWTEVPSLEDGKQYLLVTDKGGLAGLGNGSLQWQNVDQVINNSGASPNSSALWTYSSSNSSLKNGDGNHLVLGYINNYEYVFYTSTQSRPISINGGRLSAINNQNQRSYFTGNLNQYNYGITSTNSSQAIQFTLYTQQNNSANWGDTHYIVTNETAPTSLEIGFGKYAVYTDGSDPVLIAGADLALYKQGVGDPIPGTEVTGTLVQEWTSAGVGQEGSIHIEHLESGTYYLIETNPPVGHVGLSGPIVFTVDPALQKVEIVQYPGYDNLIGTNLYTNGSAEVPVYNSVAYELPETGGPGTTWYTIGGIIVIFSAILLLYLYKKRCNGAFTSY